MKPLLKKMTAEEHAKWDSGRKGGIIRRLKEGYTMPWGWGIYRMDYLRRHLSIAPIPLNFIFRWAYDFYWWLEMGDKRAQFEEKIYKKGFDEGYLQRGSEMVISILEETQEVNHGKKIYD
jgi:hypothetical protein